MGDLERALAELLIERSIDLSRLDAGVRGEILAMLTELQRELRARLASEDDLTEYGKQRLNALLREANATISGYYAQAQLVMSETITELVALEVAAMAKAIESVFEVRLGVGLPPQSVLETLAKDVLIQGAPSKDWWSKQAQSTQFNFNAAVRQGILQGETNQQIIYRITGKKGTPGIMDISRKNAASLVQTSVQTVANEARMKVFEQNTEIVKKLRWITAMDSHVCQLCAARSDLVWDMKDKTPVGHHIPYRNPPIHFSDRCLLIPELATYRELGFDIDEPVVKSRASDEGQTTAMTFEAFLARKSKGYQDDLLGPGRAELFRNKAITLAQLLDQSGRPLTLSQLRAKYQK